MLIWGITAVLVATIEENFEGTVRIIETIRPSEETRNLRHLRVVVVDGSRIRRADFAENFFINFDLNLDIEIDFHIIVLPPRLLTIPAN